MTLHGILFDKDGTLIDFDGTWGPAVYEVMRILARGDQAKFRALVEVTEYVESERRFLPTSPLIAGSSESFGPLWAEAVGRTPDRDFFSEMDRLFAFWSLKYLAPIQNPAAIAIHLKGMGLRLGIATNDAEAAAKAQAAALGLDPHMDFVAGYDSGYGGKPNPGMVLGFAEFCGVEPGAVALVGDTLHDMEAARAAGAVAIAVLSGPHGETARADLEPHADHVIGSIADLPALVESLHARNWPARRPIS